MTFDLVTDWINWKQWSEVGGYTGHHFIFMFRTTFLCVAVVGTVIYITETFTIVVKIFRIHKMETSDVENPSHERQVSPRGIRGFCEQQEIKVDEKEKAVKKIREEQGEKSSPEKLGDENEEEEQKLDEGEKSSPEKLGDENEEEEEKLNKGNSSPENVGDGSKEEEEKLDEGENSSLGNVRDVSEEKEEKPDEADKSFPENVDYGSKEQEEKLDDGENSSTGNLRDNSEEEEEKDDEGNKSSQGNVTDVSEKQYEDRGGKWIYRLAVILLILTGIFEDFPVVIITFHTAASPVCGTPARQEVGSVVTMVTIISAMMNSLWTMVILFYELCGCQKFNTEYYYKRYRIIFGKRLLLGFIFLLFSGNFVMGMLTIAQITGSISLRVIIIIIIIIIRFILSFGFVQCKKGGELNHEFY